MTLCTAGHDEICYEGRSCPLCDVIEEMNREISILEEEIKEIHIGYSETINRSLKHLRRYLYCDMLKAFTAGRKHHKECGDTGESDCWDFRTWIKENFKEKL